MKSTSETATPLTVSERWLKGLLALLYLVAAFFAMIYGLIFSTNFISQLNPLNTGILYSMMVLCYGLVALLVVLLLLKAGKSMTLAFSGIRH